MDAAGECPLYDGFMEGIPPEAFYAGLLTFAYFGEVQMAFPVRHRLYVRTVFLAPAIHDLMKLKFDLHNDLIKEMI